MNKLISFLFKKLRFKKKTTSLTLLSKRYIVPENLSEKQKEVFLYIMDGLIYKEIGIRMGIKKSTVSKHACKIFEKTGCVSRKDLEKKDFLKKIKTIRC